MFFGDAAGSGLALMMGQSCGFDIADMIIIATEQFKGIRPMDTHNLGFHIHHTVVMTCMTLALARKFCANYCALNFLTEGSTPFLHATNVREQGE